MIENSRESYQRLNLSFGRTYLHRFGRGVGFSAEFIHLLKAAAECLGNSIQVCLQVNEQPRGFAIQYGWRDYFEPLFREISVPGKMSDLNRVQFPIDRIPILRNVARLILRPVTGCDFFMFDSMGRQLPPHLNVPELTLLKESHWNNMQRMARWLWKFNEETRDAVIALRSRLPMRHPYVAVHIRRGDKIEEADYVSVEQYAERIGSRCGDIRDVYVASDEFDVISKIREVLGTPFRVHSFPNQAPRAHGYDQRMFNAKPAGERRVETWRFLTELQIMIEAKMFFGSANSNVFYCVRYLRANEKVVNVDARET